jgi:dihydrolipoamide dehydrogenase
VGGSVVSARASDLIAPVSVAVHNRLTAAQLANTSTIYPSMAGSLQEAARQVMSAQA